MTARPGSKCQEELELFLAEKAIIHNVTYQRECLRELYQFLLAPITDQKIADLKALLKVDELKAKIIQGNSRSKNPDTPVRSLDSHTVMVRFDAEKKPFFDIRRRWNKYPVGNTFLIDNNPKGELQEANSAVVEKKEVTSPRPVADIEGAGNLMRSNFASSILDAIPPTGGATTPAPVADKPASSGENDEVPVTLVNPPPPPILDDDNKTSADIDGAVAILPLAGAAEKPASSGENDEVHVKHLANSRIVDNEILSQSLQSETKLQEQLLPAHDGTTAGQQTSEKVEDQAEKKDFAEENHSSSRVAVKRSADESNAEEPSSLQDGPKRRNTSADDSISTFSAAQTTQAEATHSQAISISAESFFASAAFTPSTAGTSQLPSTSTLTSVTVGDSDANAEDAKDASEEHHRRDHRPSADSEAENESTENVCPECSIPLEDGQVQEHQRWHFSNKTLHCKAKGCEAFAAGFKLKAQDHVREVHQSEDYERYIVNHAAVAANDESGAAKHLADNEQQKQEQEEENSAKVVEKNDEEVTSPRRPPADIDGAVAILPPAADSGAEESESSSGESDGEEVSPPPSTFDDEDEDDDDEDYDEEDDDDDDENETSSQRRRILSGDEAEASDASVEEEEGDTQAAVVTPTKKEGAAAPTTTEGQLSRVVAKRSADESNADEPSSSSSLQPGHNSPKRSKNKATALSGSTTFRTLLGGSSYASTSSAAAANRAVATTSTATSSTTSPSIASTSQQQPQNQSISNLPLPAAAAAAAPIALKDVTPQNVEAYLRANWPDYVAATKVSSRVQCPECEKFSEKRLLANHLLAVHLRQRPWKCQWPKCNFAAPWRCNAKLHLEKLHNSRDYKKVHSVQVMGVEELECDGQVSHFCTFYITFL
ncbi:hypothetical protein TYRP_001540 [Tyrophagus putrescentiae]|nr:hypothetical protein TYRP_001540 [Tyrophagus putrescentiae]